MYTTLQGQQEAQELWQELKATYPLASKEEIEEIYHSIVFKYQEVPDEA